MTNYSQGHTAESVAVEYLKSLGYSIVAVNVRTKYYEIDIIAKKGDTIYFVEVKYRENDQQGRGLDYITKSKLSRMKFSAELWVTENNWPGDYEISALEISGPEFTITDFQPEL